VNFILLFIPSWRGITHLIVWYDILNINLTFCLRNLNSFKLITCKSKEVTLYRNWLRHYAATRKVVGSISEVVISIFNWPNPSSSTMTLRSTQPLTEINTRIFQGVNNAASASAWRHRHLWAIYLVYEGASTSHKLRGFHGLLQEYFYFFFCLYI
jgi:hypothetical protein